MNPETGILVVDDDYFVRIALQLTLAENGYRRCWVAGSGAEAVTLARHHRPDAVVMDYKLRDRRGLDGVDYARQILAFHACRIIFLTGDHGDATLNRMREIEAAGLLIKPVTSNPLLDMLNRLP